MRIVAALVGNLKEYMEEQYKTAATAITKGVKQSTDGLKLAMRNQVTSAGMSKRLANTWRGDVYPKGRSSINAAGVVRNSASKIMLGFENSSIIRVKNRRFLAIPTPSAPKQIMHKRITPELYEKAKGKQLHFIYRPRGPHLLVVQQKRKTIPMFWLVPQVKMPKKINFKEESQKWSRKMPGFILENWKK